MEAKDRIKEIDAILSIIETKSNEFRLACHEADQKNKAEMEEALPWLESLKLTRAEKGISFGDEKNSLEITLSGNASFYLTISVDGKIKSYSASGISDRNPTDEEFKKTVDYYSDIGTLLKYVNTESGMKRILEAFEKFQYPDNSIFKTGFNEYELKQEKYRLEKEIKIQKLDFKVGGIYQFLTKGHRGREYWAVIKVTSSTPKRFKYVEFYGNSFSNFETSATIDFGKIKSITEEQKILVEGK